MAQQDTERAEERWGERGPAPELEAEAAEAPRRRPAPVVEARTPAAAQAGHLTRTAAVPGTRRPHGRAKIAVRGVQCVVPLHDLLPKRREPPRFHTTQRTSAHYAWCGL